MKVKSEREVAQSCPTQRPHGLQPTRLLRPRDFPGKSTGVGAIAFSAYSAYFVIKETDLSGFLWVLPPFASQQGAFSQEGVTLLWACALATPREPLLSQLQPPRFDDVNPLRRGASWARVKSFEFCFPCEFQYLLVSWFDSMKETPLSNCERRFLLRAIEEKKVN